MALDDNTILYSVSYNLNGGEGDFARDSAYYPGETMEVIWDIPTREGYSFGGWYREDTQMIYNAGDTYILDQELIVFTALWYEIPVGTVTFDLMEGSGDFPPISFYFDKGFTVPETVPEREGYDFYGWYSKDGTQFKPGDKYEHYESEDTLTASWTNRLYTMIFDPNGGTYEWVGGGEVVETVSWYPFPIYAPYRDGYNFLYWEDEEGNRYVEGDEYNVEARDMTFMAYWEKETYITVTFDSDGGNYNWSSVEIPKGTTAPISEAYKDNHTFLYWVDQNGNKYYPNDENPDIYHDTHLTAVWEELVICEVTFDANGGSYEYPLVSLYKGCEWVMSSPTWEGHTFLYWIDDEGNRYVEGDLYILGEGQVTMTAIWDTPVYTVKYEGISNAEIAFSSDSVTVTTATPEKEGHTFVCWENGENTYNAGDILTPNADMTLSAQWERYAYAMTYEGIATHNLVSVGDSYVITSTVPAKEGHDFVCWRIGEENYNAGDIITPTDDMTFEAVWTPRHYTVTFDLNGGTGDFAPLDKTYGVDLTLPENAPTKDGVNFIGWTASDGENYSVGATLSYNGDITLTAVWKCILTFDLNGRVGSYEPIMGNEGESIVLPSTTARAGYNLAGWKNKDNVVYLPGGEYTFTSASHTLTAIWEEKTYNVIFDLDGGEWSVSGQTKSHYSDCTLPTSEPTKEKHVFLYWRDENEIIYKPGDLYKKNSSVTLKAQWKQVYTITYLNADGNVFATQENVDGETVTLLSETPQISDGYFSHWGIEDSESRYFPGKEFSAWRDIELIPVYNIKYVLDLRNGDTRFMKLESAGNGRFYLPTEVPTKEGYDFVCWRNEENGKLGFPGQLYISGVSEDIYAVWVEDTKKMVIYDLDGGTGDFPDQTASKSESITLHSGTPVREGYTFEGWFDRDEAVAAENETVSTYTLARAASYPYNVYAPGYVYTDTGILNLKALWKSNGIKITNKPMNNLITLDRITYQLETDVLDSGFDSVVTWSSSNPSVVYVNSDGVLNLKTRGKTTITATLTVKGEIDDYVFTDSFELTVSQFIFKNNKIYIDDDYVRSNALLKMEEYYSNSKLQEWIDEGNTCIFAFEGLGDPSLKDDDSVPNGRKNTSDIHPIWLYNAMMVVTKGKNIVYVTRRASTLPDKATSSSNTTLKEGIYTYKTGNHPQYKKDEMVFQYIAMVPTDDPRVAWYKEGNDFVCKESGGTNLHAGTALFHGSTVYYNSEGCQIVHFKDYISFGKAVGFLQDNNALSDITSISSLGQTIYNTVGAVGNSEKDYSQDVTVKYILDRNYDNQNPYKGDSDYADPAFGDNSSLYENGIFYPLKHEHIEDICVY